MAGLIFATSVNGELKAIVTEIGYVYYDRDEKMNAFVEGCKPLTGPITLLHNGILCFLIVVSQESLHLLPRYCFATIGVL